MDFEFSAEQEMLRASVRAFLDERAPIPYVRDVHDDPYRAEHYGDDEVWTGLANLGVLGLLVPEAYGGAGGGMVDAAVVLEELGRAVCPTPFAASAVAAIPLLLDMRDDHARDSLLPDLVNGETVGTVAIYERGSRYEWRTPSVTATPSNDDWALHGEKVHVPAGDVADVRLTTATDPEGQLGLFAEESAAWAHAEPGVDPTTKHARLEYRNSHAMKIAGDATAAVERMLDRLGVAYVVDSVGAAQRALELAVEYAKERVQFDKPIGSFQAVQHLCADMLRTVELGRAAAYYACWALDEAPAVEAHRAATLARAFAADAFPALGGTAIQVFGGIGFTWEHDIHLYYKRLLTLSVALGNSADHLAELAAIAID
jgi:alkylation response protein AidB-like acyl-CoA dehydrogenase